ncbi:MAG TPA: hypothetical protein VFA41_02105 [Ktedonobacteraceae bacterium]|jgi:hypothetical protein|nr:hypothetical protein [Ktedonobacteraceae bacterium]
MWPFDQNNQQMYQQYANAWDQGNYAQLPEQEVRQNYGQFIQNAPPQVVEQVHQQYYQQMPPEQRGGLMQGLMNGLMQRGINPQQAGIQNTNPYNMSPQEAARLTSYTAQQSPDLLHQVLGPGGPLGSTGAKLAVAGIAALAAKQLLGGSGMRL